MRIGPFSFWERVACESKSVSHVREREPGRGSLRPCSHVREPGRGSLRPPAPVRRSARRLAARSLPGRPPAYVLPPHNGRVVGPRHNGPVAGSRHKALGAVVLGLVVLALVGCAAPTAAPAPTVAQAPTAAPPATRPTFAPAAPGIVSPATNATAVAGAQAQPTVDPNTSADVVDVFLSNVDDVSAEAYDLSLTPCDDMMRVLNENPNLVPSIRGFAANLKRVGASQAVLDTPDVTAALADLDQSMAQLESALSVCGISQP
jgi:hypothetical protein